LKGIKRKRRLLRKNRRNQSTIAEPEESVLQVLPSIKKVHEGVIAGRNTSGNLTE
jgi:hypothetical protein